MIYLPAVQPTLPGTGTAWCFAFVEGKLLLPEAEGADLLPHSLQTFEPLLASRHYLGVLGGLDCWVVALPSAPTGWRAVPLRVAMMQMTEPLMSLAGRAAQVLEWDRTHRFCGACGTPTELHAKDRARTCPACGQVAYPRISPAMMALVWRGSGQGSGHKKELLLARAPHFTAGMYSALAGFVEAGESLEDCVVREVAEEVGVRVKNLHYFGSQSWPFPNSLMVAYTAEWVDGEIVPQPGEIETAGWFSIDALPPIPPRFSISGHLIRDTVQALRETSG